MASFPLVVLKTEVLLLYVCLVDLGVFNDMEGFFSVLIVLSYSFAALAADPSTNSSGDSTSSGTITFTGRPTVEQIDKEGQEQDGKSTVTLTEVTAHLCFFSSGYIEYSRYRRMEPRLFQVRVSWDDVIVNQEAADFVQVIHEDEIIPVDKTATDAVLSLKEGQMESISVLAGIKDENNTEAAMSEETFFRAVDCNEETPYFPVPMFPRKEGTLWHLEWVLENYQCADEVGLVYGPDIGNSPMVREQRTT